MDAPLDLTGATPSVRHRNEHRAARWLACFAGSCSTLLASTSVSHAQPASLTQSMDPFDLTGQDFAGLRLAAPVTDGIIEFIGQKAWAWTATNSPGSSGTPTQRLLISGDCIIRLGTTELHAAQASVFLSRLPVGDADASPNVWQVFAVLDRVSTPAQSAALAVAGDRLSVQAVVRADQGIRLRVDRRFDEAPDNPLAVESQRRLAQHLRRSVLGEPEIPGVDIAPIDRRGPIPPLRPGIDRPLEPATLDDAAQRYAAQANLPPADRAEPIFAKQGLITFDAGSIASDVKDGERVTVASGGVAIQYWDAANDRTLELTAQQVVLFSDPSPLAEMKSLDVAQVRGIYLEGDVTADDGKFTLRSPRVYYDVTNNRGVMADVVFSTYDPKTATPIYIRAKTLQQESRKSFTASSARLSNTAFFEPELTIGASTITVTSVERPDPEAQGGVSDRTNIDARNITLRAYDVPFFYIPRLKGDIAQAPLREFRIENSNSSGMAVKTTWNLWSLTGLEPPRGVETDLLVDWYFDRGLALGTSLGWSGDRYDGGLLIYGLMKDDGRDVLSSGEKKEFDGDFRGMILGQHRTKLTENWSLFAEVSQISDPTFVDGFFDSLSRNRREFANSLMLRRTKDNTVFTGQVKATADDFVAAEYQLQSQGYFVEKLPELTYTRLADDILGSAPGTLSYSSEYRVSSMRLSFTEPTAREFGFSNLTKSVSAFGLTPGQSIADGLRAAGYTESMVTRADTRHELSAKFSTGPLNIVPFVVGRLTMYDDSFEKFSPEEDDQTRLWGAAGARASTSLVRVDDSVESSLFDLHRIRHIIEPHVTVFSAGTGIKQKDLPVYDARVESLAEGTATSFGIDQTWQTQRGAPGRWRSVDVVKLNSTITLSSDDVDLESPYGRWNDYRPEYSNLGNYWTTELTWQVTEVTALAVNEIFDLEKRQSARTSVGGMIQHSPDFSTYAELTFLNPEDQTFVFMGAQYQLNPKYGFSISTAYDTKRNDFQNFSGEIRRRSQSTLLGVGVNYNNITGETSFGFTVRPWGFGQGFGSSTIATPGNSGRASRFGG